MKKTLSTVLAFLLLISILAVPASAKTNEDILLSRTVETLENGDMVVTELYKNAIQPRAGITGHKTTTYYTSSGSSIFNVTVEGTFTYTYGVTCVATKSVATVGIFDSKAVFVSKSAYTNLRTAYAAGTVSYNSSQLTGNVDISCDKYGKLS